MARRPAAVRAHLRHGLDRRRLECRRIGAVVGLLKTHGVDLVDVSTGGNVPKAPIPVGPGYQVQFAERIRQEAEIPTGAVGLITTPAEAEAILANGQADLVLLAREFLRAPYFPLLAAQELGADVQWPAQYERAKPRVATASSR